ncbi:type II toxin-antitoxin system HicA family toxin [Sphingomonas psychrolutea]|uniref:Addiction module toxin, HicA family protein n=1 Tax=Sphingomonas psychrolutea TaxID=1259676 RepID=A0ABQ1H253_9SPHN|nr:type II toxin-antitoxin system HicA family toxin [Sphingomonas psychrolutea]GGA55225.1 addiction module toxin, HicA family protein [Sphingomonas psychrolutea]
MRSGDVIRRLEAAGWLEVRQSGSHKQFKHPALPVGTLKSIERQSGLKLR